MSYGNNNPWNKYKQPYSNIPNTPQKTLNPVHLEKSSQEAERRAPRNEKPTLVELPRHLYIPDNAQSVDIRKLCVLAPGEDTILFNFEAPQGSKVQFLAYGIFTDAQDITQIEFIPTVDGSRVFPYHGDPTDNFRMNLGLAPDLSNQALIQCQLTLNPKQVLSWRVRNFDPDLEIPMGVRMIGYVDYTQNRGQERIGG